MEQSLHDMRDVEQKRRAIELAQAESRRAAEEKVTEMHDRSLGARRAALEVRIRKEIRDEVRTSFQGKVESQQAEIDRLLSENRVLQSTRVNEVTKTERAHQCVNIFNIGSDCSAAESLARAHECAVLSAESEEGDKNTVISLSAALPDVSSPCKASAMGGLVNDVAWHSTTPTAPQSPPGLCPSCGIESPEHPEADADTVVSGGTEAASATREVPWKDRLETLASVESPHHNMPRQERLKMLQGGSFVNLESTPLSTTSASSTPLHTAMSTDDDDRDRAIEAGAAELERATTEEHGQATEQERTAIATEHECAAKAASVSLRFNVLHRLAAVRAEQAATREREEQAATRERAAAAERERAAAAERERAEQTAARESVAAT